MKLYLQKEKFRSLLSKRFLFISCAVALLYLSFTLLLPNYRVIFPLLQSPTLFFDKLYFLFLLLSGSFASFSFFEDILFIATAVLVGMNLALSFTLMQDASRLSHGATVGTQTILGLSIAGCSSCGVPIFSIVAASIGISILPLQLQILQLLVIVLLGISFIYTLERNGVCKIRR